jgi:Domain of unknown function (DUF6456)
MPPKPATKGTVMTRATRTAALDVLPSAERLAQSPVEHVAGRDAEGWPVMQCRAIDTIGRLIRSGMIDVECGDSADRFRRDFQRARFEPLCASDLRRTRGAGGREEIRDVVEDARQRVWNAMNHLGGMSAPAGSIIWHVVGLEATLRDWSLRQVLGAGRTLRQEVATGILVAALGVLNGYYTQRRHQRRDPGRP